ncbi:MAG TPA: TonB-dependent receptor [Vicinamibacterales bacterium]|nr:TonB-dependent receptor [Vicinamibacterales bacterium]
MSKRLVQVALMALCLLAVAAMASAQVFTGRIDVTAKDGTGAVLPGVTVEISGVMSANSVTDSRGEAHFLNLAPGKYVVTAKLSGFNNYKNDNVPVGAGSVVPLVVTLTVGNVATSVEVKAETPVLETKKVAIQTNVSLDELQNIPTSRDPWVILQTVPGVVVDRVNVGGAESGQQSNYQAKGARGQDNTWNMDGVPITDMAALGSSPTYYDFDMFQEMQVTTGGADVTTPTPGAGMNFVLRSGTNRFRGSARYYFENDSMQADNVSAALSSQIQSYNRTTKYFDTGFEVGGPIVKDKLWAWGAYGRTEPNNRIYTYTGQSGKSFPDSTDVCPSTQLGTFTAYPGNTYAVSAHDCTILKNTSLKVNGDINADTRASFTYFRGDKQKFGRGASATHPDETTWNQKGPTSLYKAEVNRTISNNLFLTGRYAHITGGFSLTPRGGASGPMAYVDDAGTWHNNYVNYVTDRPQDTVQLEGNSFKGIHELKFGFGWRKSSVTSDSSWPGGGITFWDTYPNMEVQLVRDAAYQGHAAYWNGYLGDTITKDRYTFNLGVRWDRQAASIGAASVPANPLAPTVLPALQGTASDNVVVYNSFVPRLGVTYALGKDRKTLLRATYSRFADQLDSNIPFGLSLAQIPYYSYAYYAAKDLNGNHIADPNEFTQFLGTAGFNPEDPLANANKTGNYATPMTDEFVIGADHELMANFGLSASYTWRRRSSQNWNHLNGVDGSDFTQTGTLTGNVAPVGPYSIPLYTVNPAAVPSDFGLVFEERNGYHQSYKGLEIIATKRMSNNWMMRMSWAGGANREYFDSAAARYDPTPSLPGTQEWNLLSPNVNGGVVITPTSGSGKSNIYLVLPKYQYVLTFAYNMKYDINFGFNYLFRQGYAEPYYNNNRSATADPTLFPGGRNVIVIPDVDQYRLPNIHSGDLRISKALNYKTYTANIDFDIFNVFNTATTLGKQYNLNATNYNKVLEIMNPRIMRIGVRFGFK